MVTGAAWELHSLPGMNKAASPDEAVTMLSGTPPLLLGDPYCIVLLYYCVILLYYTTVSYYCMYYTTRIILLYHTAASYYCCMILLYHTTAVLYTVSTIYRTPRPVCVLHVKLTFPPINIQHNQCPCRRLLQRRALLLLLQFVVTNYDRDTHCIYSKVIWPCNEPH